MKFAELAAIEDRYANNPVIETIAPDDEMWTGGEKWYFDVGREGLHNILQALSVSRLHKVATILDLPCGHGRVARHIRAAFPDPRLVVCDLNQSGVDFCSGTLGAEGVYSQPELTDLQFDRKFDVIWVGSLFTHVDLDRAQRWLAHLCKSLNQDGVLIATFHGEWSIQVHNTLSPLIAEDRWKDILAGFHNEGWGYAVYDGSTDFGVSLCRPWRVIEMASSITGIRIGSYRERGWANNHDVLTLVRTDRFEAPARKGGAVGIVQAVESKRATTSASQVLRSQPTANAVQARLTGFFCQPKAGRPRQPVEAYRQLSPGVHIGFQKGANVQLTNEPKMNHSLSPETCLNTVRLRYTGTSRFLSLETYCSWSDFSGAQRFQLGVYAVPDRIVSCRAVLRLPKKGDGAVDLQFSSFELRPDERARNPSGPLLLPEDLELDRERNPLLLIFFDTSNDLEVRFDYISLYFS